MSSQHIRRRTECRLCGATQLRRFLHFDDVPFFDEIIPFERLGQEFLAPMDVFWCESCTSVQTQHDVDISAYYRDYQYVGAESPFVKRYMQRLAQEAYDRFDLEPGDRVIEVGSADGYQLECFRDLGATVLGFEPAENLAELSRDRGIAVMPLLFTSETVEEIPAEFRRANVIVMLHVFDHILDPVPFLRVVHDVLDPERGVFIIEVHDFNQIVGRREAALFGHEHATYLHLGTMKGLLERCGLRLLDANLIPENERRGNTMLIAAGRRDSRYPMRADHEGASLRYLDEWSTYQQFERNVTTSYNNLRSYVRDQVSAGKRMAAYGGWGRGSTTLALAKLTGRDFVYVCDRNVHLHGRYTPGSHVLIAPPERLFADEVDEVIVFNYGYLEEIREQLQPYTRRGGRLTSVTELLQPVPVTP